MDYWDKKPLIWMRCIDDIFFSGHMGKIVFRSSLAISTVVIALLSLQVNILK